MNKRYIILGCIVTIFLAFLGASAFMMKKKQDFRRAIACIPGFCLPTVADSLLFCNTQLDKGKPVVVMYFHSECDFCQIKAQQLQQKSVNEWDIQWVMVSYAAKDSLNKFMETYNLDHIAGLVVLMDPQLSLYDRLQVKGIPTCFIYNRQHQLVAIKQGSTKLEQVIQLASR